MKWICQRCGYSIEREGHTEICPQCWEPTMQKEIVDEQQEKSGNSQGDCRTEED